MVVIQPYADPRVQKSCGWLKDIFFLKVRLLLRRRLVLEVLLYGISQNKGPSVI